VTFLRRGKFLTVKLSDGTRLIFHFGMSGRLVLRPLSHKHDHFALKFSNGLWLTYSDFRRFGRIWRIAEADVANSPPLQALGPDALSRTFSSNTLRTESRRSIKLTLLDQRVVSGIGNIYSCESLYHAAIDPTRMTNSLSGPKERG
jgi:formamidopyrimidine-DNA glycosylase